MDGNGLDPSTSSPYLSDRNGVSRRNLTSHITPSGETYHTTCRNINTIRCGPHEYRVGLYGWRRKCLYSLVLLLLVVVIVNLALTLFILRVLDFSSTGIGGLQIVSGGVVATGNVNIMDTLVASKISSRPHAPLRLIGSHNITLEATDESGHLTNRLFMDANSLECTSDNLMVKDEKGRVLFSASKDEVLVGAETLKVTGEGGAVLSGSIQTAHVTAPVGQSLLLESATSNLEVVAPQGIALESRAGAIEASCLDDFTLKSTSGMIKFDTPHIYLKGLPTSTMKRKDPNLVGPDVYQVCVCSGGKIFLATPGGVCAADNDFCK